MKWPTQKEIEELQRVENARAEEFGEEADRICDCGMPGYACQCEEIAYHTGRWQDGTKYRDDEKQEFLEDDGDLPENFDSQDLEPEWVQPFTDSFYEDNDW